MRCGCDQTQAKIDMWNAREACLWGGSPRTAHEVQVQENAGDAEHLAELEAAVREPGRLREMRSDSIAEGHRQAGGGGGEPHSKEARPQIAKKEEGEAKREKEAPERKHGDKQLPAKTNARNTARRPQHACDHRVVARLRSGTVAAFRARAVDRRDATDSPCAENGDRRLGAGRRGREMEGGQMGRRKRSAQPAGQTRNTRRTTPRPRKTHEQENGVGTTRPCNFAQNSTGIISKKLGAARDLEYRRVGEARISGLGNVERWDLMIPCHRVSKSTSQMQVRRDRDLAMAAADD